MKHQQQQQQLLMENTTPGGTRTTLRIYIHRTRGRGARGTHDIGSAGRAIWLIMDRACGLVYNVSDDYAFGDRWKWWRRSEAGWAGRMRHGKF